ncbi:MAG: hypothetical protein BZY88_11390 [SAR202 cluster bacterium Io17-Chloro-G9]|nr:MAG: hypothetical protein BZY88_11390 [SAR202 cluster bacterium Io17-Chloro-G9]
MSAKLVAILVLAILTVSVVVTGVAAISAAQGNTSQFETASRGPAAEQGDGESALVNSFKFVCPFH